MLTKNRFVLVKEEATYGTDPTPTPSANAIEVMNFDISYEGDKQERDTMRNNISPLSPLMGKRWIKCSFDVEIKGGGTKGTASRVGDLLEACGFAEVVSAGSSVTYSPANPQSHKSVTIYAYDQVSSSSSILHKITGVRGTMSLKIEAGGIGIMSFDMKGLYNAPTDVVNPTAPTYETTLPPIVESSLFTLNSVNSLIVQAVNIDLNNEIVEQDDINSVGGIKGFIITARKPSGSLNPEAVSMSTYNFQSDFVGATARALSLVIGSANGNKLTITAPKLTLDSVGDGDRNGLRALDIPFSLSKDAGNDELILKFE
ncbi:MAG TPA: phage tail tube protein [Candidatus Cloacimonas acidaminovorans]|nr:phage tail tube protein [Candidatus Cloacimonas acidaminovorans]